MHETEKVWLLQFQQALGNLEYYHEKHKDFKPGQSAQAEGYAVLMRPLVESFIEFCKTGAAYLPDRAE